DAAETRQSSNRRNRICRQKRDLAGSADGTHAEPATGRDAKPEFVQRAKPDFRVRKHHFDVRARDILEELQVNVSFIDAGGEGLAPLCDPLLGGFAAELVFTHRLLDAHFEWFELEHQEEPLKNRNVEFLFPQGFPAAPALVLLI